MSTATVKLRRLELREKEMFDEVAGKTVKIGDFKYRVILKEILMSAPAAGPGQQAGLSAEEIAQSIMVYGKVKDAIAAGEDFVLLDKESFDYVLVRLRSFRWGFANEVVHEFCEYLKNLKEDEYRIGSKVPVAEEKKAEPAPQAAAS